MKSIGIAAMLAAVWAADVIAQDAPAVSPPPVAGQRTTARIVRSGVDGQPQVIVQTEENVGGGAITVQPPAQFFLYGDPAGVSYAAVGAVDASPHWIGLGCSAATDSMRAQLGLTDGGVVVYDIVDKGPAQSAGFQKHDVLIKAVVGEKEIPLKDSPDLVRAVKEANLKSFKVEGIRAGKPLSLEVTPAERPQPTGASVLNVYKVPQTGGVAIDAERVKELIAKNDHEELKKYIQQQMESAPKTIRHYMAGPVVAPPMVSATAAKSVEIPDNVTITITRTGNQPAVVKVQKGDDWWKATGEKELDTIPQELRGYVQRTVQELTAGSMKSWFGPQNQVRSWATRSATGAGAGAAVFPVPPAVPQQPGASAAHNFFSPPTSEDAMRAQQRQLEQQQKQIDAVLKQIEELTKAVEKSAPKN